MSEDSNENIEISDNDFKVINKDSFKETHYSRRVAFDIDDGIEDTYNSNNKNELINQSSTHDLENDEMNNEKDKNNNRINELLDSSSTHDLENDNKNDNSESDSVDSRKVCDKMVTDEKFSDDSIDESSDSDNEEEVYSDNHSSDDEITNINKNSLSEIYVISVDNVPLYYINDIQCNAYEKMHKYAIECVNSLKIKNPEYRYFIELLDDEIVIESQAKLGIIISTRTETVFTCHIVEHMNTVFF